MDKKKKTLNKIFRRIFLAILIAFTALYISMATGYYEFKSYENVTLTNSQIEQFEKDIKSGKDVDALDYLTVDKKDYSSNISKFGLKLSQNISKVVKKVLDTSFKFLNNLFTE